MKLSRRDQLRWLAALPFAPITSRAVACGANAFVGTWSGTVEYEAGRVNRFRLVVTPDGEVMLQAIDIGLVDARATKAELSSSIIKIEFASLGVTVRGVLTGRNRIDAVASAEGETRKAMIVRGDLYHTSTPRLPPGPMTSDRLHSLLLLSGAPAVGVGWAFKQGPRTVLVNGVRSLGAPTRVMKADAWHIGSNTKSMTATLTARLVEAGHLKWTTTIGELLSTAVPAIRAEYRDATLVDLLSHHAGLPREERKGIVDFTTGRLKDARAERLAYARLALSQPPVAAPRTTTSYSNAGYIIVGAMLEQVMGAPWEALMAKHLFAPLNMRSAGFGPPVTPGELDAPVGHARRRDNKLHPWTNPAVADLPVVVGPAGLVHASLSDLLVYLEAHRDRPERLLTKAGWEKLQTPPFGDGAALGWGVDGSGSLSHAGSNGMWIANVSVNRPSGMVFAGALNAATPQSISVLQQSSEAALLSKAVPVTGARTS